ncbi:M1 family metallopeptidase [Aureivirga sp. CE67]|uniref:M1 family metallopeptidase n=1 Tax=Aureivirga sp. CE67 TaxID=1788983 RepID=UPI0018C8D890|nr:M1 family metallopeptidase [Aureivirga sp. CE67]
MRRFTKSLLSLLLISSSMFAQEAENQEKKGHYNTSKFKQLDDVLPTPNMYRTGSGAPGAHYTQQKVDYVMNLRLDEDKNRLYGEENITYHNNSQDPLEYLWVQLDQNVRAKDSQSPDQRSEGVNTVYSPEDFTKKIMGHKFDGGFNIEHVKDVNGKDVSYMINRTMMRINLPKPLLQGETYEFSIKWWYNINNYIAEGGRSGYEPFESGNNIYVIAQFFPRLAVYSDIEGWQNLQFWGRGEFALEFGDYDVNITVPADHVMNATGVLQNTKKLLSKKQYKRFEKAQKTFDNPMYIVTPEEALEAEKGRSKKTKTWHFKAQNVRDFAFATSRKFMWDAMAVDVNGKTVMAYSLFSKEGNPLWEEHSTRVVAQTLKTYSRMTFDYPYHKAISVHARRQGMEYPMICFNYGRPKPDGTYSDRVKYGMIGVIVHEVGHNFFPMIVNSDERRWTWMDEGINSFVEMLAEYEYDPNFPVRSLPSGVVGYMGGDQSRISPIMTQSNNIYQFGSNAYAKPAAGLWMLRKSIMGEELFDFAFRTYARRWMFKHPSPADFFRTMEDASAFDLDWFWRGWFYTTDWNDIAIKDVNLFYVTDKPTPEALELAKRYGITPEQFGPALFLVNEKSEVFDENLKSVEPEDYTVLSGHINEHLDEEAKAELTSAKYIYEVTFSKPGGLVMPIIVEFEFEDGTKERKQFPAQIWRFNDKEVMKVFGFDKKIKSITVDPENELADIDESNNSWPNAKPSKFEEFKNSKK